MKVSTLKNTPAPGELIEILKNEFSDECSYKLFGFGEVKSIVVQKSTFVGAQIFKNENEIIIEGTPPSVTISFFLTISSFLMGFGAPISSVLESFGSPFRKLEMEIGYFLNQKYN